MLARWACKVPESFELDSVSDLLGKQFPSWGGLGKCNSANDGGRGRFGRAVVTWLNTWKKMFHNHLKELTTLNLSTIVRLIWI